MLWLKRWGIWGQAVAGLLGLGTSAAWGQMPEREGIRLYAAPAPRDTWPSSAEGIPATGSSLWRRPEMAANPGLWPYSTSDSQLGYRSRERTPRLARLSSLPVGPLDRPKPVAAMPSGFSTFGPEEATPARPAPPEALSSLPPPVSPVPLSAVPSPVPFPRGIRLQSAAPELGPEPEAAFPALAPSPDPGGVLWTNLEILMWAGSGQHLPPMMTTGDPITPQNLAGKLFTPHTRILFPLDRVNNEFRPGFRLSGGTWLDLNRIVGLEGDFFFLRNSKKGLTAASDANGNQILARPFINAVTGIDDAILVAYPGVQRGAIDVQVESFVIGGGTNALFNLWNDLGGKIDLLAGYRYFGLFDEVSIKEDTTALSTAAAPLNPGDHLQALDRFRTFNHFHGGVLGIAGERRLGVWFLAGRASVALGGVRQVVEISGRTVLTPFGGLPTATAIGRFALPSNIGRYQQTTFAVLPEVSVRGGVQLTESARLYVAYNWMYLSNVVRAGEQIDPRINPIFRPPVTLLPGEQPPVYSGFRTSDYWLQGLSFGMEVRF